MIKYRSVEVELARKYYIVKNKKMYAAVYNNQAYLPHRSSINDFIEYRLVKKTVAGEEEKFNSSGSWGPSFTYQAKVEGEHIFKIKQVAPYGKENTYKMSLKKNESVLFQKSGRTTIKFGDNYFSYQSRDGDYGLRIEYYVTAPKEIIVDNEGKTYGDFPADCYDTPRKHWSTEDIETETSGDSETETGGDSGAGTTEEVVTPPVVDPPDTGDIDDTIGVDPEGPVVIVPEPPEPPYVPDPEPQVPPKPPEPPEEEEKEKDKGAIEMIDDPDDKIKDREAVFYRVGTVVQFLPQSLEPTNYAVVFRDKNGKTDIRFTKGKYKKGDRLYISYDKHKVKVFTFTNNKPIEFYESVGDGKSWLLFKPHNLDF